MLTRIAVLADYASLSQGNKLNILGIFSIIYAAKMPTAHPQMQVVVQFEFEPAEAGKKDLKIALQDDDAKELFGIAGQIEVPRGEAGEPAVVNQVLQLNNVLFPKYGGYEFCVLINGEVKAHIPLKVIRLSAPASNQQQA